MWSRDIHHINHLLAIYVKLWQQCQSRNNHSIWMYFKQWASFKNQFWTTWVQEALHKWVSKHLSRSNLFEYVSSLLFSLFTCQWQSDSLRVLNLIINHLLQIFAYWRKNVKIPQMDKNSPDAKILWMDKNSSHYGRNNCATIT